MLADRGCWNTHIPAASLGGWSLTSGVFPPFSPGGSVCLLLGPDRPGSLHHAAGEGRRQDPDSPDPQPREEGPAGRDR